MDYFEITLFNEILFLSDMGAFLFCTIFLRQVSNSFILQFSPVELNQINNMYTLVNKLSLRSFLSYEMPALLLSWIIAEVFYKFGSFTLETGAFLVTWYLSGLIFQKIFGR
jgi:hypothetical protein